MRKVQHVIVGVVFGVALAGVVMGAILPFWTPPSITPWIVIAASIAAALYAMRSRTGNAPPR